VVLFNKNARKNVCLSGGRLAGSKRPEYPALKWGGPSNRESTPDQNFVQGRGTEEGPTLMMPSDAGDAGRGGKVWLMNDTTFDRVIAVI